MATTSFTANGNKTVTVEGLVYTVTANTIPDSVTISIDGTPMTAGTPVNITQNSIITLTVQDPDIYNVTFPSTWSDLVTEFTFNGSPVTAGGSYQVTSNSTIGLTVTEPTITIDYTNTSTPVVTDS